MKGIIFTTDAIFALIIAGAALSILSFFVYSVPTPYLLVSSQPQILLNVLSSTALSAMSNSNPVIASISSGYNARLSDWKQSGQNATNSGYVISSTVAPSILNVFTENAAISTPVVEGYGNVYFGAGNFLYAVNLSTMRYAWNRTANTVNALALYNKTIFYNNANTLTSAYAINGLTLWTNSLVSGNFINQPVVYNGNVYASLSTNAIDGFYTQNGLIGFQEVLTSNAQSILIANASIVAGIASGNQLVINPNALVVWNTANVPSTTALSFYRGSLYFGNNLQMCSIYLNDTSRFCISTSNTVKSVSVGNGFAAYAYTNGITMTTSSGSTVWSSNLMAYGTTSLQPILTNTTVYSVWSSNLIAENITTGNTLWVTMIPKTSYFAQPNAIAAGSGNLYLVSGNSLIIYGPCYSDTTSSLLAASTALYLAGSGSCATYLLNSLYTNTNYGFFVNGSYGPTLRVASFNGISSFISTGGAGLPVGSSARSVFAWVYMTGPISGYAVIHSYGTPEVNTEYDSLCINSANDLCFGGWSDDYASTLAIPANSWNFVGFTYNAGSTQVTLYSDGQSQTGSLSGSAPLDTVLATNDIGDIGRDGKGYNTNYLNGRISDVQVYSTALSASQVSALYSEGIAGAPISGAGNVGWYPLEGDTNDYSGYNNTGYPVNVTYVKGNYLPSSYVNSYSVSSTTTLVPYSPFTSAFSLNAIFSNNGPRLYRIGVYSWQ